MYPGQGTFVSFAKKMVGTFEKLVPDPAIQKVKIRLTKRRGICGAIPFNTDISELRLKRTCEPFAPTTHAQHIRNFDHATQYASRIQYMSSNILES